MSDLSAKNSKTPTQDSRETPVKGGKGTVKMLTVSSEFEGQRLDNFLINRLKGVPRTRVYRIVRKGEVRVNKGRVKPSYRLMSGDLIRVPPIRQGGEGTQEDIKAQNIQNVQKLNQKFNLLDCILYEDENLIVLNKPEGMAVHGGSGISLGVIEAMRILRPKCKSLELVHRLDRDTSGCLMIAKKRSVLRYLHEMLRLSQIDKVYWALVDGRWQGPKVVDTPLIKNQLSSGERIVKPCQKGEGQHAVTHFSVLEQYQGSTLLEVKPITGRTHQIRVHTAQFGNPVLGDEKYGWKSEKSESKSNSNTNPKPTSKLQSRLYLHAREITFQLPDSKKPLTIKAPLDSTFTHKLNKLSKENTHD